MTSGKATSRARAQAQTREALLDAARKLVAERGFGGASIGDITTEAGFTKGAFYSNFPSREAMLLELLGIVQAEQEATLKKLEERSPKDLAHEISHLVELAVRHANHPVTPLLIAEIQLQARRNPNFADVVQKGFEARLAAFAGWIDALKARHQLQTPLSSLVIARTVMALSQGYAQQPADRDEIRAMATRVLERLFL